MADFPHFDSKLLVNLESIFGNPEIARRSEHRPDAQASLMGVADMKPAGKIFTLLKSLQRERQEWEVIHSQWGINGHIESMEIS